MALTAKFARNYRSKKGNSVFKFIVTGSVEEIEAYKTAQGQNYREEDITKEPLFFTPIFQAKVLTLLITPNNKVVVDNTEIAAVESMIENATGIYQQELAKLAAAHTFAKLMGDSQPWNSKGISNNSTSASAAVRHAQPHEDLTTELSLQAFNGADLV